MNSDPADGVVRVQSAEDKVTRECRLHAKIGGFGVTNLTDHDDVWILAEQCA